MMNDVQSSLLRGLLNLSPKQRLDRGTRSIFRFYKMMRDNPELQPEEFLVHFPDCPPYYPVVQMFARALDRNSVIDHATQKRAPAPLLGKKLGDGYYRILYRIANGNMGEVYVARPADAEKDDLVAIKIIHTKEYTGAERDLTLVKELRKRLDKEAHCLRHITNHDYIIQFFRKGYDSSSKLIYIVTEFIEGRSLAELSGGLFLQPLPATEILWLTCETSKGLVALHGTKVPPAEADESWKHGLAALIGNGCLLHRDIKPSNILLDKDDRVRLIDLGLAGPEGATTLDWGTKGFMAPEQINTCDAAGQRIELDQRVDIYSLGKTFFSLLTRLPIPPDPLPDKSNLIWQDVPGSYADVILKATHPDRERRYQNAEEFLAALNALKDPGTDLEPEECRRRLRQLLEEEDREVNIWVAQDLVRTRHSRRRMLAAGSVGVASLLGFWARCVNLAPAFAPGPVTKAIGLAGSIDVTIWHPGDIQRQRLSLKNAFALPLRRGDQVRVSAQVNQKVFLYIIWIDAQGIPQPIYPWLAGKWEMPPSKEQAVDHVELPESTNGDLQGWGLKDEAGMETIILLASKNSKLQSVRFKDLLSSMPHPKSQSDRAIVWFEKASLARITDDPDRGPQLSAVETIDDAWLHAQAEIHMKFAKDFPVIEAISFANGIQ
jgi:serine/threonine protein kinase